MTYNVSLRRTRQSGSKGQRVPELIIPKELADLICFKFITPIDTIDDSSGKSLKVNKKISLNCHYKKTLRVTLKYETISKGTLPVNSS